MINSFQGTLAGIIEITINRVLPLDPAYQNKLSSLSGQVIAISLTDLQIDLFFLPDAHRYTVLSAFEGIPNVKLRGNSWDFFHMSMNKYTAASEQMFDSHIHFEGDVNTGQKFEKLFAELNIDWEEILADVMGDVFAQQAVNVARQTGNWLKEIFNNSQTGMGKYLQQDLAITPTAVEVTNFYSDLVDLSKDSEQLISRFQLVANQLHKPSTQ